MPPTAHRRCPDQAVASDTPATVAVILQTPIFRSEAETILQACNKHTDYLNHAGNVSKLLSVARPVAPWKCSQACQIHSLAQISKPLLVQLTDLCQAVNCRAEPKAPIMRIMDSFNVFRSRRKRFDVCHCLDVSGASGAFHAWIATTVGLGSPLGIASFMLALTIARLTSERVFASARLSLDLTR